MNAVKNINKFIIILSCLIFIFVGCVKEEEGFKSNFFRYVMGDNTKFSGGAIVCDVISSKRMFNIDQVTMDFYYGYQLDYTYGHCEREYVYIEEGSNLIFEEGTMTAEKTYHTYNFQCIALYFRKMLSNHESFPDSLFENYQEIENFFFIKELTYDDFFQEEEYGVSAKKLLYHTKLTYVHYETFTVPSELFSEERGRFAFCVLPVYLYASTDTLDISPGGLIYIYYKRTDDNTVELSLSHL